MKVLLFAGLSLLLTGCIGERTKGSSDTKTLSQTVTKTKPTTPTLLDGNPQCVVVDAGADGSVGEDESSALAAARHA
jgi:hypothetical protein